MIETRADFIREVASICPDLNREIEDVRVYYEAHIHDQEIEESMLVYNAAMMLGKYARELMKTNSPDNIIAFKRIMELVEKALQSSGTAIDGSIGTDFIPELLQDGDLGYPFNKEIGPLLAETITAHNVNTAWYAAIFNKDP